MIYLAAGGLLDANPGLLVWTIITFLVVVFILRAFAWNPILHALDERAEKIHGDIEKADKIRKEAEELLATYNAKITAARDEALAIVSEANSDAVKLKAKTVHETQDEIKAIKEQSLKDIELAKLKAVQELQAQIVDLSVMIASQILQKKVRSEDHAEFVKEEIAKLKSMKA
ncbi:MAG: F0F1 ATP synthase subunit B [Leptospiraceae bacterium]|nr:F0F1 ATP synthase subunit B [Leptospiraceae bacterium]MBL0262376.1 F0F1 ATP synthase subunit B [Leptospiraceae bacterium]